MTSSLELPRTKISISMLDSILARVAVAAARTLARQSPKLIQRILSVIAIGAKPADLARAQQARDTILTVSTRCRGGRACLPRSIAAALLCRMRGIWPTWCIGVLRTPPFIAHAWIEANQRLVDEVIDGDLYVRLITVRS